MVYLVLNIDKLTSPPTVVSAVVVQDISSANPRYHTVAIRDDPARDGYEAGRKRLLRTCRDVLAFQWVALLLNPDDRQDLDHL